MHVGEETLAKYRFGKKTKDHWFCPRCGSSVGIDFCMGEQGVVDPEKDELAMNVRLFADLDLEDGGLEYTFWDGRKKMEPQYWVEDLDELDVES